MKSSRGDIAWLALATVVALLTGGCALMDEEGGAGQSPSGPPTAGGPAVDVSFLLSMTFDEAKKISPASMELGPRFKFTADEITIVSQKSDGTAKRVRAKGHVYLQLEFAEPLTALGQEALVTADEVILRGRPLVRRGRSVVEGMEDRTVFYIKERQLRADGLHRLTTESQVTPAWRGSWKDGPNPLLPALSPEDVPKNLKVTPLLPSLSEEDTPKAPQ